MRPRTRILLFAIQVALAACGDCAAREAVDSVERLPYPQCDGRPPPEGKQVASRRLRPSASIRDRYVREDFRVRRRGCLWVIDAHYEWHAGIADLQVVYDRRLKPLRAWRRMLRPGQTGEDADVRLYELRTAPITITQRARSGEERHFTLEGDRPVAVVGPGRGLLSMWIRKADLAVGDKTRGPVLDLRGTYASIETVALRRDEDRRERWYAHPLQVYTVYGRDTVFTDAEGVVVGDLAGLRPAGTVDAPVRRHRTDPPPADPVNTP